MLKLFEILYAFEVSIFTYVLYLLIQPGQVFGFWGALLIKKQWQWPAWVRNPLGDCSRCLSGQIGLWTSIFYFELSVEGVILFTAFTIFFNEIWQKQLSA